MQYIATQNRIYLEEEGEELAEITFLEKTLRVPARDHTYVGGNLRGQGTAEK